MAQQLSINATAANIYAQWEARMQAAAQNRDQAQEQSEKAERFERAKDESQTTLENLRQHSQKALRKVFEAQPETGPKFDLSPKRLPEKLSLPERPKEEPVSYLPNGTLSIPGGLNRSRLLAIV